MRANENSSGDGHSGPSYNWWRQGDRRRVERRSGERRGDLRWDPKMGERDRRSGKDRREFILCC
ncbi:MAG: hypothetical protein HY308_15905 [Gammaproteobacteria bacterium]|nr:hypothetical protein [Gammaproteobacteria bacterium]